MIVGKVIIVVLLATLWVVLPLGRALWPYWRYWRLRRRLRATLAEEAAAVAAYDYASASMDDVTRDMVPVHLRVTTLSNALGKGAPVHLLKSRSRDIAARLADASMPRREREELERELETLETWRNIRAHDDHSRGFVIGAIVFFVFAIALFAWRYRLFP